MDILIKNMEMPKNCFTCIFSELNDYGILVCIRLGKECTRSEVRSDCPLVALPEHGDLADKIDIIHRIEKIADADLAQDIIGEILASPTIVEASE